MALLGGGGWVAYQQMGPIDIESTIGQLTRAINLPGSQRTAADTSFGGSATPEDVVTPEDALAKLSQETQALNAAANSTKASSPAQQEIDPATIVTDGPPLPKLKPADSGQQPPSSLPAIEPSAPAAEQDANDTRLATNSEVPAPDDTGPPPSIFERLWRYLAPG